MEKQIKYNSDFMISCSHYVFSNSETMITYKPKHIISIQEHTHSSSVLWQLRIADSQNQLTFNTSVSAGCFWHKILPELLVNHITAMLIFSCQCYLSVLFTTNEEKLLTPDKNSKVPIKT